MLVVRLWIRLTLQQRGRDTPRLLGPGSLRRLDHFFRHDMHVVHLADRILQMPEPLHEGRGAIDASGDRLEQIPQPLGREPRRMRHRLILDRLDRGESFAERGRLRRG